MFYWCIVVVTTLERELQAVLSEMNNTFKEYNLKINAAKTKNPVYYGKNMRTISITLENKGIVQVDYFECHNRWWKIYKGNQKKNKSSDKCFP